MESKVGIFFSNLDTLISKIFKAKYYPKREFMDAKIDHNPSYNWRSICSWKVLLRDGYRWRTRSDANIIVWSDPWLRKDDHSRLITPMNLDLPQLLVQSLLSPNEKKWNLDVLSILFNYDDVQAILSTLLFNYVQEDNYIWSPGRMVITVSSQLIDFLWRALLTRLTCS